MAEEISINMGEFRTNITKLRNAVVNLESGMEVTHAFDQTNIEPFTKDLENIQKILDLIERYKGLLDSDITVLESTGEKMQETDEKIAQTMIKGAGPQPTR